MALQPGEKQAVKDLAKVLVDVILPEIITAEEARLPVAYQPIAAVIVNALIPQITAALDAKINAM